LRNPVSFINQFFTLTNTDDKTRSIGSTFIWQLKYFFQWEAYFSPNFAKSGIHKVRDIWGCEKNNFKDSNFIFNTLIDKRNWISQWTRLKGAITGSSVFVRVKSLATIKVNFGNKLVMY
jgi:hypothetical protein